MTGPSKKEKFLKLARDRFKQADEADKNQRERELDDLRFYAGDQWPADIKASRAGMTLGSGDNSMPVPARPCITINKTREPVRVVLNQERGSDMGIEIVPADDFGEITEPISETEIQLREGLVRRIQRESKAADARTWAFSRATIAGRGYYGVMTRYAPGKTNDQEVYIHRFYNQASVLGDPSRQQPDGSDAEFWLIGQPVPWNRYKEEHPKRANGSKANSVAACNDSEWRAMGDAQPDWFIGEGDLRTVLVVDYWYVERTSRELLTLADGSLVWDDEAPEGIAVTDRRTVVEKSIKWAKIDGCDDDVLEETDWPGPDMPIIQVLGEELHPYDKEARAEGMVRPMREPCQGNNAMISKFVEMVAMTPVPTLMMAAGQQETFEAWYQAATTRTLPFLLYNQKDIDGMPAPPPFSPPNRDMPIAPVATGLQMFSDAIQSTSAISDPAMGQTDSSVKSAKHANLLREQAAQGTSNFLDNLMRSMRYEAQIVNNLLYPIYSRPGRLARIINGEGEADSKLVGVPMTMQNGRPVQAPPGLDGQPDPQAKTFALTKDAQFNVAVKISKNYDTRRQQEASVIGELLAGAPALMTWFGDLFFKNQDGPGHTEMADRAKVMLDPKILQMIESKKQGLEIPPQVQAQLAQLTQEKQQLQQQLQQAGQMIQTEQVKEQAETQRAQAETAAKLQIAQLQEQAGLEKARMDNATKLQIEEYKLRGTMMQAELDARQQALGAEQQQQSEAAGRAHEAGMSAMSGVQSAQQAGDASLRESQGAEADRAHQAMMAERGQQASSADADAGRQFEAEQAELARQAAAEQAAAAAQQQGAE